MISLVTGYKVIHKFCDLIKLDSVGIKQYFAMFVSATTDLINHR